MTRKVPLKSKSRLRRKTPLTDKFVGTGKIPHRITFYDNQQFQSGTELEYYKRLQLYRRCGDIRDFKFQDNVTICKTEYGEWNWMVDFKVIDKNGRVFYIDTKGNYGRRNGFSDERFKACLKLWKMYQARLKPLLILVGERKRGVMSFRPATSIRMDAIDFIDK